MEPGNYDLSNKIQWIYFDPYKKKYDTLKSSINLNIKGESKIIKTSTNKKENEILELLNYNNNQLQTRKKQEGITLILNIITLTLFIVFSFFLIYRKYG